MNNLLLRSITGFFFVASILLSLWLNTYAATAVFSVFFLAAVFEYASLFNGHEKISFNRAGFLFTAIVSYAFAAWLIFCKQPPAYLIFLVPLLFLYLVSELWRKQSEPVYNISAGTLGLAYIVLPFSLMLFLTALSEGNNLLLIGMFLLIWTNDTFAYLVGRVIGKTKLFERISPKKTWEGTLGGIFFTFVVAFLLGLMHNGADMLFWLVSAALIVPAAIVGDLLESLFKRNLNLKDSGSILPGHGGILDRFDATLFALPFFCSWAVAYKLIFLN